LTIAKNFSVNYAISMAVMNLPTAKDAPNSMLTGLAGAKSAFSPRISGGQTQVVSSNPPVSLGGDRAPDFDNWRRMRSDASSQSSPRQVNSGEVNTSIASDANVTRNDSASPVSVVANWSLLGASFAVLSGLLLTCGYAYSQIVDTKPQSAGNVAGAVTSNEALTQEQIDMVVAAVRSGAVGTIASKQGEPADLSDTPAISKVVSSESVRQQNPVFFARVQEGDLLVKFQQYTALYRPSTKEIIAQGSLRMN
jgi:hypothetical protein